MRTILSKLIRRFQKCIGLRLFKLGRWQAELWYCPAHENIPFHKHEHMDSYIFHLFGPMIFIKDMPEKSGEDYGCMHYLKITTWGDKLKYLFKPFKIESNRLHSASVWDKPGVFLNIEHWDKNTTITSAATDFHAA